MEEIIVGVVGTLQMDVLEFRLKNEYGVDIKIDHLPYRFVRWIETEDMDLDNIDITSDTRLVTDLRGRNILLFQNEWGISWVLNHNNNLTLTDVGKVD
jgi:peptide chain release factor 3